MFKILSDNYFAVQRADKSCDVYTLGQRCEVVKCCHCINADEAIQWVSRAEGGAKYICGRFNA